jgi:hypothetical protein
MHCEKLTQSCSPKTVAARCETSTPRTLALVVAFAFSGWHILLAVLAVVAQRFVYTQDHNENQRTRPLSNCKLQVAKDPVHTRLLRRCAI